MTDTAFVEIFDSTDQLPVELSGLLFIQASISDDEVKKLTSVSMFHNHEQLLLGLDDLIKKKHSQLGA